VLSGRALQRACAVPNGAPCAKGDPRLRPAGSDEPIVINLERGEE